MPTASACLKFNYEFIAIVETGRGKYRLASPRRYWMPLIDQEKMMIKITALLFVVIAPTLMGILIVAVLSMSSPINGGTPLSQQGMVILMVVIGAAIAALPISYFIAGKINQTINS